MQVKQIKLVGQNKIYCLIVPTLALANYISASARKVWEPVGAVIVLGVMGRKIDMFRTRVTFNIFSQYVCCKTHF